MASAGADAGAAEAGSDVTGPGRKYRPVESEPANEGSPKPSGWGKRHKTPVEALADDAAAGEGEDKLGPPPARRLPQLGAGKAPRSVASPAKRKATLKGGNVPGAALSDVEATRKLLAAHEGAAGQSVGGKGWQRLAGKGSTANYNLRRRIAAANSGGSGEMTLAFSEAARRKRDLERRMRLWRGVARMLGVLMSIRRAQIFRQKMFGRVGSASRMAIEEERRRHEESQLEAAKRGRGRNPCLRLVDWHALPRKIVLTQKSEVKRWWDMVFVLSLFWTTFRAPFIVAFNPGDPDAGIEALDIIAEAAFYVDVAVGFITIYVNEEGEEVTDLKRIAINYARTWLAIDCVAAFPYHLLSDSPGLRAAKLLRLMRLAKVEAVEKRLVLALDMGEKAQSRMKLGKLVFYVLCAGHVTACVWYLIADSWDKHSEDSWTQLYGVADQGIGSKYSAALYWATATLTTVGYGDVSAHTDTERVFAMFCIILGAGVFGMIVGKVSMLAQSMSEKETEYKRRQMLVMQFLKHRKVPKVLRTRTFDYYEYVLRQSSFMDGRDILNDLSPSLRRELTFVLHRGILRDVPVLSFGSHGFQAVVVERLVPTLVLMHEYIVIAGEAVTEMYFVKSGAVAFLDNQGYNMRELENGSFFGEKWLLDTQRADESVRAIANCELLRLSRDDLQSLLIDFPEFESTLRSVAAMRESHGGGKMAANAKFMTVWKKRATAARSKVQGPDGEDSEVEDSSPAIPLPRPCTPPLGLTAWGELVHHMKGMETAYVRAVENSRTLQAERYNPEPEDMEKVVIPEDLDVLVDTLAANMHAEWSESMVAKGHRWGKEKDDKKKTHNYLVPYEYLPEIGKLYDRGQAALIVKRVLSGGFEIVAPARAVAATQASRRIIEGVTNAPAEGEGEDRSAAGSTTGAEENKLIEVSAPKPRRRSLVEKLGDLAMRRGSKTSLVESVASERPANQPAAKGSVAFEVEEEDGTVVRRVYTPKAHKGPRANAKPTGEGGKRASVAPQGPSEAAAARKLASKSIKALISRLAVQAHLSWSRERMEQGWSWGHHRDDRAMKTNLLVPYDLLTPEQKATYTNQAVDALSLTMSAGFRVEAEGSPAALAARRAREEAAGYESEVSSVASVTDGALGLGTLAESGSGSGGADGDDAAGAEGAAGGTTDGAAATATAAAEVTPDGPPGPLPGRRAGSGGLSGDVSLSELTAAAFATPVGTPRSDEAGAMPPRVPSTGDMGSGDAASLHARLGRLEGVIQAIVESITAMSDNIEAIKAQTNAAPIMRTGSYGRKASMRTMQIGR